MLHALKPEFSFAGFTFPRYIADLPKYYDRVMSSASTTVANSLRARRASRKVCGPYYHAPRPNAHDGRGFYLDSQGNAGDGAPVARVEWRESDGIGYDDCEPCYPMIARLPHGRYLSGWTMGPGMCASLGAQVFDDESEAWRDAREEARRAAEDDCEHQAAHRAECDAEDACIEAERNTYPVTHCGI